MSDSVAVAGTGQSPIQGQLLRLSARRAVAIYLRDGRLWIADFVDGQGELVDPAAWFRFNCGTPSARQASHRMLRESAIPLSADLVARIERLHPPPGNAPHDNVPHDNDRKEESP